MLNLTPRKTRGLSAGGGISAKDRASGLTGFIGSASFSQRNLFGAQPEAGCHPGGRTGASPHVLGSVEPCSGHVLMSGFLWVLRSDILGTSFPQHTFVRLHQKAGCHSGGRTGASF